MSFGTWSTDAVIANDYLSLLAEFGASSPHYDWAKYYATNHAGRCLWDAEYVSRNVVTQRCLNIGGAPFVFEFMIKRQKSEIDVTSIDLNPDRFPNVEKSLGIRVLSANIEHDDCVIDEKFDCIVLAEVFEHMRIDLIGTLRRIRELLTDDGVLFVTTPNGLGLGGLRRHWLRGRTGPSPVGEWEKLGRFGHMGHVREYSPIEVEELLGHCGFAIEKRLFRTPDNRRWPIREWILPMRPSLADEVVIVARRSGSSGSLKSGTS